MTILSWAIRKIASMLPPPRVIRDELGREPYLSRWYLLGSPTMPDGSSPFDGKGDPKPTAKWHSPFGLYLHRFHQSDTNNGHLHSHPWRWAMSIVLVGGYVEFRRHGDAVRSRKVTPLALNFIRGTDYHRVELLEDDAWSIFIVGPKVSSWSFWNVKTRETTHWRTRLDAVRAAAHRSMS